MLIPCPEINTLMGILLSYFYLLTHTLTHTHTDKDIPAVARDQWKWMGQWSYLAGCGLVQNMGCSWSCQSNHYLHPFPSQQHQPHGTKCEFSHDIPTNKKQQISKKGLLHTVWSFIRLWLYLQPMKTNKLFKVHSLDNISCKINRQTYSLRAKVVS